MKKGEQGWEKVDNATQCVSEHVVRRRMEMRKGIPDGKSRRKQTAEVCVGLNSAYAYVWVSVRCH